MSRSGKHSLNKNDSQSLRKCVLHTTNVNILHEHTFNIRIFSAYQYIDLK